MNCKTATQTNGSESILMEKLNEIHGNEFKAAQAYAYFDSSSEQFIDEFGNYLEAYGKNDVSFNERLDDNGEPKLFYDEVAQKHYFLDKNYNKTFYPLINRGLRGIFSYKQIEKITSRLANNYFKKSNLNFLNIENLDADEVGKLPNLKLYVEKEIKSKIAELNTQGIKGKLSAKSLEKSLKHIDEYVKNIDALYKKMSLKRIDTDELDTLELEGEEVKDHSFSKQSFELDGKATIPNIIKLKLSLLEDKNNLDPIWNESTFVPFDDVFNTLLAELSNDVALEGEDIFQLQLEKIEKIANKKPYLKALVKDLRSSEFTENNKNQFARSFNWHLNNFLVSEIKTKLKGENNEVVKGYAHIVKEISESGSKSSIILSEWGNNFKNLFLESNNKLKEGSETKLKEISASVRELQSLLKDNISAKEFQDVASKYVEKLRELGVELTQEGFNNFLDGKGNNIFNFEKQLFLLNKSINQTSLAIDAAIKKSKKSTDVFKNPFLTEGLFKKLSSAEAYFMPEGSDASIWSGGKNKWLFSYPSYLSTKILQWKKNPQLLKDLYNQSSYTKGSSLMEFLLGMDLDPNMQYVGTLEEAQKKLSDERLEKFRLGVFNMFQEVDGDALNASDLSLRDYFNDSVNKVLSESYSRTTTPADKSSDMQLKTGFFVDSFSHTENDGKVVFTESVHEMFFKYFNSEVNRMKEASKEVDAFKNSPENLTIHYHYKDGSNFDAKNGNAFQSQYFPELSFNSESKNPLVKEIKDILYDKEGNIKHTSDLSTNPETKRLIRRYINLMLNQGFNDTVATFFEQEILSYDNKGELQINNIDNSVVKKYNERNLSSEEAINAMISDYYINSLSQNIEYSKMFTGDVAFYKNMIDYKKRVPATYTDGLQLRITKGNEFFNVAVIDSVEIESPAYTKLVKMLGEEDAKPYKMVNSADAQAWITPKRWKFLLEGLGKWTSLHDSVYEKMTSDNPREYTKEELKVAAQPLKGVYFYLNGKIPSFLKYSQAVLTKNMVSGNTGLESIFKAMDDQNVDELLTLDAFKVGSPTPTKVHNKDGSVIDYNKIKFNVKQLTNYGWKLQQDLPVKTLKQTDVGSQIQKNIFGGLKYNTELAGFDLDGKQTNGQTIIDGITNITGSLIAKGLDDVRKQFGIDKNGKIKNVKGFYNTLISELEKRGGSQNVIDALKKETALYGIPQAMDKITNVFASVMNDRLIKIKSNGGAFIQMSNFGMSKSEGSAKGAVWNPNINEGATTMEPERITEDGKVKIKPGQILISGSFLAKYIPNWRSYSPESLFVSHEGGDPIISKDIQENIIGYRIPNQGLSSNDALQIVGILPEENGDTIVAYTGITKKTGSDFDIDKMYIMMANYELAEDGRLKYEKYDPSKKNYEQSKGALQNRLIELYKSVLTHPKVIKNVMKPVDIEFIKDDINDLVPNNTNGPLFHFNAYNDTVLRYEFINGKAGVGQEANALVDINRLGKISLNKYYIGWGHKNELNDTEFDREFSEQLSQEDLEQYLKDVNPNGRKDNKAITKEVSKVRIADSLTAILNAFVDIAKDPYITRGNWTTSTTNTGNLLLRAGVHPLYVTAFMAQPIIKQYIEYQAGRESIIIKDTGDIKTKFRRNLVIENLKKLNGTIDGLNVNLETIYSKMFKNQNATLDVLKKENTVKELKKALGKNEVSDDAIQEIINTLKEQHTNIFESKEINVTDKSKYNLKYFRDQIKKESKGDFQIAILDKFFELQELSKNVKQNVDISKLDTNGMGKNINSLISIFNMRQNILDKESKGEKGVLNGFESKLKGTVLGKYYDAVSKVLKIVKSNPKLFPQGQDQVQEMFNEISQDLYDMPAFDNELLTDLEKSYHTYVMNHFPAFNLSKEESRDLLSKLPSLISKMKKENKGKYLILDELEVRDTGKFKTIGLNNRKKSSDFEEKFTDSWRDLRVDNPKLAEDLIKYSFLTSGFKMNASQFFTYIPNEYLMQEGINRFINVFTTQPQSNFLDKFYLNNSFKNKYVRQFFDDEVDSSDMTTGFTMKKPGKSRYYIKRKNQTVYKLQGYNSENKAVYIKAKTLGYKSKGVNIVEYGEEFTDDVTTIDNKYKDQLLATIVNDRDKFDSKFVLREVEDAEEEDNIDQTESSNTLEDNSFTNEVKEVDSEIKQGQYVKYSGETYIVTKENSNGTVQIYNPNLQGVDAKKSVSKANLTAIKSKAKTINYKGSDYLVTPNNTIISVTSNKAMRWDENNGDRKAILELANNDIVKPEQVSTNSVVKPTLLISQFTPANEEQFNAIDKIQDFINDGNPNEIFILEGKAGTGKTTIVQEAIAPAIDKGKKVLVGALSHKAKLVLADKLEDRFPKKVESGSIAGILGMKMDLETGEFERDDFADALIDYADIVIIDEASMVNEEALELIMKHKRPSAKVIFLGDRGQLPPIRKDSSDDISLVFSSENKASLTERVRQGEESPILPYADYYWNNSEKDKSESNPVPEDAKKDVVSKKGSLVFAENMSDIFNKVSSYFKTAIETKNPNLIKIVTYKNATRQAYNKQIRKEVFGENAAQLENNDIIMFQNNYKTQDGTEISNSDEFTIDSVSESNDSGYSVFNVTVKVNNKSVVFSVLNDKDKSKFDSDVASLFEAAKKLPKGVTRTKAYKSAWALKNKFADIDYAYAITSHKSQGSTYDNVIVDVKDINSVGPTSNKSKSRSIYTGLTRAKYTAIVIDKGVKTNEDNVKEALSNSIPNKNQTTNPLTKGEFSEVKDKWESSGRTKEEWDLMSAKEIEHVIKNCL